MLGVLVPVLFVLALVWLASMTWRYEAVWPPYRVTAERKAKPRLVTAAALKNGLADNEFWDGEGSVRLVTWLHLAVVAGFLAIVLGVTTKALTGSPHVIALWWIAVGLGGATVALGVGYVCLDALDALTDQLRGRLPFMLGPAAAALIAAGLFAWLQPGGPAAPGGGPAGDGQRDRLDDGSAAGSQASVHPMELIRELAAAPEVRPA